MSRTQQIFEAIMRGKGMTELDMVKGKYKVPAMQARWSYFKLGWEMREVMQ
jgi:hypothetical protein